MYKYIYKLCLKTKSYDFMWCYHVIDLYYFGIGIKINLKKALKIYKSFMIKHNTSIEILRKNYPLLNI